MEVGQLPVGQLPAVAVPRGEGSLPTLRPLPGPPLASPLNGPHSARNPSNHVGQELRRKLPQPPTEPSSVRVRRFFFEQLTHSVKPTLPLHYDVLLPSLRAKDSAYDHLRYRYVDFVCPTTTAWHGMLDTHDSMGTVDAQKLMEFFQVAEPRTRIDAYPMYVLLRDILHRQLNGTLKLINKEAEALRDENKQLKQQLQDHAERIANLQQQVSVLGEQLRAAELVREQKERAEAALKQAEQKLAELTTDKFKQLMKFGEQSARLKDELEHERETHQGEWTSADLAAMLSEALEQRGPDDRTLEQAFSLLGEENSKKVYLRMKRAHPTLFKPLTKYKYMFGTTKDGQAKGGESDLEAPVRSLQDIKQQKDSEEHRLQMRLQEGVGSREEEADIHYRLAHLEEEKMLQHEMEQLQHNLRTGDLSVEQELQERERLNHLEGLERSNSRKELSTHVSSGLIHEQDAHAMLLSLDDADARARDHDKIVTELKSGNLSEEELSRMRAELEKLEHDKRLAAASLTERLCQEDTGFDGIESAMADLVHTADYLRGRLMNWKLTAAQRRKLEMELEELETASDRLFQAAMNVRSDEDCQLTIDRTQELRQRVDQSGQSGDDKKRLQAELDIVQKAAEDASRRTDQLRACYKQAAHSILSLARSMKIVFGKANRGLVDHDTLVTTLQDKAGIVAKVEGTVQEAAELRVLSHADLAASQTKAEMVRTGIYSTDELAKMDPAKARDAMREAANARSVVGVVAATQTEERCLGVRKVEDCLSKYVEWDRGSTKKNEKKTKSGSKSDTKTEKSSKKATAPSDEPVDNPKKTNEKKAKSGSKAGFTPKKGSKKSTVGSGPTDHSKDASLRYHSGALHHAEGISRAKPDNIEDIRERTAKLFHAKMVQDKKMDGAMMRRACLPDFFQETFLNQYGLQTIATKHVHSFAAGVLANEKAKKPDRLVRLLGRLAGIVNPERFSSVEVNFVMDLLELIFEETGSRLQDALLKNLHIDGRLVHEKVDVLLAAYAEPWHAELMTSLEDYLSCSKLRAFAHTQLLPKSCFAKLFAAILVATPVHRCC